MDFSQLYTPEFKNRNKAHFAAIVNLALADDHISEEEKAFIDRLAIYLEIDPDEVAEIMESPDKYKGAPPADKNSRLERLYDLSRMVFADNIADDNEKKLLNKLVIGLGFDADSSDKVVEKALEMVAKGIDVDDFIETFEI
ncbi:MAG: TerB family tellurite resistance protein [Flavobacteriaceae bacterium]|nr:TerB family tellurite resistance protein [Flavobacteriaceae bacterium]